MAERTLLWVDLTLRRIDDPTVSRFEEFFVIRRADGSHVDAANGRPDALCFDFDYPDRQGLKLLEETKRQHPSIPLLMLTLQHSEELAVWAFRARVWDYFSKPVSRQDIRRCHDSLCRMDRDSTPRQSVRQIPPIPTGTRSRQDASNHANLQVAVAYVRSNYADKISQAQVAKLCGMSTFRFSRHFHAEFGLTFQDYLSKFRIARAEELLKNPEIGVSDVAYAVGYRDVSYFGRVFRKQKQMSPTQWRQQQFATTDTGVYLQPPSPILD
ncbi:MAG: response regulator transcription factor [Gammaproteobacteria bacterium]|nr:response regulator transcription factor [Gammaproteobacteria bacterium]